MSKHEIKYCPRCNASFECKVGSISLCECTTVELSENERAYIHEQFEDCLCADCMKSLKVEYHHQLLQGKLKSILGIFYRKNN